VTLTHIFVFTAISIGSALLLNKWRSWVMLVVSVLALFWLQPGTPIRNLGFWLPIASLALTAIVWAITHRSTLPHPRSAITTAIVILIVVLLIGLLRYIELPREMLFAVQPPQVWAVLMGLVVVVALVLTATRLPATPRAWWALVLGLIALFVVLKAEPLAQAISWVLRSLNQQNLAEANARDLNWLGFSYIAFRLIHVLREKHNNKLVTLSLQEFVVYVLFFPALTAGPIDRSDRFVKDLRAPFALEEAATMQAVRRILIGIFKKFALADTLSLIALNETNAAQLQPGGWVWVVVFAYALRIYLDFSGYTDIALGLARWFGIKLPENFNNPYLKPNLTQFWNSWHMSLSQWFRAYWFNPLTRALRQSKSPIANHQSLIVFLSQSSTMLLIALWHGITLNFVAWGVWHALGLFVHNRWAEFAKTKGWAQPRRITNLFGTAATFVFVSLGWVWFALPSVELSLTVFQKIVEW
jgi:D-alanyl-lipoteichoic acid acyltransferase DltB (MBOAT superfamily)